MGDTKLLPCPFCGETPIIYDREHHPKRDCWTVICNNDDCPACLVYADRDTEAEAIAAWNTRPVLLAAAKYEEANPLGGPATMLEAAARRIRAGEDFHEVLADYGLLARQEGEDWLPIESAPRDGSVIDLFGRERFASCFWDSVSKEWRQYYSEAIPCSFSISDETPTHWRRLPGAPAARSGGGGSVVKFSDTDGWDYEIHQDPIP